MQHMNKAELYNVDNNRVATAKQIYAVSRHFAKLQSKTDAEAYKLTKVFGAIMMKFNAEHSTTPITHGDIAKFFELKKVPAKFVEQITSKAPKASPKPVAKEKKTAPKASEQSLTDFKARLEAIDARFNKVEATVESHGKRLASMDAKLDILMAWLETNPDA